MINNDDDDDDDDDVFGVRFCVRALILVGWLGAVVANRHRLVVIFLCTHVDNGQIDAFSP